MTTATAAKKNIDPKDQFESKIAKARKKFFDGLPKRIVCSNEKCKKDRKKEMFGVRLMNKQDVLTKDAEPRFLRQSYCNECRHA